VAEEELRFAQHRRLELLVEVRIRAEVGIDLVEILQAQPLRGETRREDVGAAIGQQAASLPLDTLRRSQLSRIRRASQLGVGQRRPEEYDSRDARSVSASE
jgi:hypothetical protein